MKVHAISLLLLAFSLPVNAQRNLTIEKSDKTEKHVALVIGNFAYK